MPMPPRTRSTTSESHPALSMETFRALLDHPTGFHAFTSFLQKENSEEKLNFYSAIEKFRAASELKVDVQMSGRIYSTYVHEGVNPQISLSQEERHQVIEGLKKPSKDMFTVAQEAILSQMFQDSYRRFIHILLQKKAQDELLAREDERYDFFGLGDCFCLTDPSLPDNPIVAASDGFVKVTGYTRQDIIPQNCRFLQGEKTEKEAVKRIGQNLREEKSVSELLLNYKKDGTPFWNLLYICPLQDSTGKTKFFLGGQVDVTPNMINSSPLKTILEAIESINRSKESPSGKTKKNFFDFIRRKKSSSSDRVTAESLTVNADLDLESQKDAFLETYTNFLVFDAVQKPGAIMYVSERFSQLTGFENNSIVGSDCSFMKGPLTSRNSLKQMKSAMKNGSSWSKQIIVYDANKAPHLNHIFLTPILNENSKPKFFIAVMRWKPLEKEDIETLKAKNFNEKEEDVDCWFQ